MLIGLLACSDEEEKVAEKKQAIETETAPSGVQLSEREIADAAFLRGRIAPHKEDLTGIRERGVLRALVTFSPLEFVLLKGEPHGFQYELLKEYETFLNEGVSAQKDRIRVIPVPVPFERLIPALRAGDGDIAAAGLTVTPKRAELVAFAAPYLPEVDEIVMAHKAVEGLNALEDLAGRRVHVLSGSTYAQHLRELSDRFEERGLPAIEVIQVDEILTDGDILEMVHAGIFEITVADAPIGKVWAEALAALRLHADLKIRSGGELAWAVRRENPELLDSLNAFMKGHKKGTLLGNILFKRYYENTTFVKNPLTDEEIRKLETLRTLFRTYGDRYDFDWIASVAQGYQESRLDQNARSKAGAIGIMQILPSTAADPNVNIKNIDQVENNIHAGIKYTAFLRDRYFSDPEIEQQDRLAFAFAAYNLGPNRVAKLRERAQSRGLDPNKWFGNVEMVALNRIGREPVHYVSNIHEYYVAYRLYLERQAALAEAVEADAQAKEDR